jgi:hypothetical protein
MRNRELSQQHNRLKTLISKTEIITAGDMEAISHWAKYLCVLSAGFLENSIQELYGKYCSNCANPNVTSFAVKALNRIQNPKASTFLEVAGSFKEKWRYDLEKFIEDEGRKEAINSIMSNRHLIAHGKDTSISLARIKEYLKKSVEVIEFIEDQFNL